MLTILNNFENNISIVKDIVQSAIKVQFQKIYLMTYYSISHKIIRKKVRNLFMKRYSKKIKHK